MEKSAKNKPSYKPSLLSCGFWLVMLPFLLSISGIAVLNHLWYSSELAVKEEQKQNTIIHHLNLCFDYWANISLSMLASSFENGADFEKRISSAMPQLRREFAGLHKACKNDPVKLKTIRTIESSFFEERQNFLEFSTYTGDSNLLDKIKAVPKVLGRSLKIRTKVREVLSNEMEELFELRREEDRWRKNLKAGVYAFMCSNILIALTLIWLFRLSFKKRMKILMDDAARLPLGEPLTEGPGGNDELDYLHKAFLEASSSLKAAAEHRRSILGMVAHDMRSPLMAAQNALELIAAMEESLSTRSKEILQSCENKLDGIVQYVEALLSVERERTEEAKSRETDSANSTGQLKPRSSPEAIERSSSYRSPQAGPQLYHKVLAMVLLPLAMQLSFLFIINKEIGRTEKLSILSRRYNDIRTLSTIAQMDMLRSTLAHTIFLITGHPSTENYANKAYRSAQQDWNELANLGRQDPEWESVTGELKNIFFGRTDSILKLKRGDSPQTIKQVLTRTGEVNEPSRLAETARKHANDLYAKDSSRLEQMEALAEKESKNFTGLLIWGSVCMLTVTLAALTAFGASVKRRLQMLVKNAGGLYKPEKLPGKVPGSDELAYLDMILHNARESLNQASRQRAEMMAELADNMRTPLLAATQDLQNAENTGGKDMSEKSKSLLDHSSKNITRVLALIDDLLSMETLETGKIDLSPSLCEARSITDEALSTVATLAENKQLSLINDCDEQPFYADRSRIAQVLINYLSNAIKFSPAGKKITVANSHSGNMLRISVNDEGPGMNEGTRARVFEKFFQAQTAERKHGFGLGLAICSLIIESHGGRLGVESEEGKGSSFWFEIPVSKQTENSETELPH